MLKSRNKLLKELQEIVAPFSIDIQDSFRRFTNANKQVLQADYDIGSWDTACSPVVGYAHSWNGIKKLLKESRQLKEIDQHKRCDYDDCFVFDTGTYCDQRPSYNVWTVDVHD